MDAITYVINIRRVGGEGAVSDEHLGRVHVDLDDMSELVTALASNADTGPVRDLLDTLRNDLEYVVESFDHEAEEARDKARSLETLRDTAQECVDASYPSDDE